uniref:RNA helicase n=1 Tax=viral metagenome TaxID=1070528 RepID=A0A6C0DGD9_9ZZZZ
MFTDNIANDGSGENEEIYDSSDELQSWDDLNNIDPSILRGIYSYGFERPSPIQKKAIKPIMSGRDIIAQAQSGTGKTAAFSIGALSIVDLQNNFTQVLILSPTRELTIQTSNVVKQLSSMMNGLKIQTVYGGSPYEEGNNFSDKNTPHIICGCPGRVHDLMRKNRITSKQIKLIILDEADEMLSSGFKEQVYNIFQYFNNDIQVALFSATLPNSIYPIINKIMRNPIKICVRAEQLTLEGITQFYVAVEDDRQKYATLKHVYQYASVSQCIIYCNSIKRVIDLYDAMKEDQFPVCCIHSNMERNERETSFKEFKNGKSRVLISSNVTARGIDIQQVSVVINFDLPKDIHTYLHRIGRSGRWGRKGVGINFITRRDISKMKEIEAYYSCEIKEMPVNLDFLESY